jgi:transketolase
LDVLWVLYDRVLRVSPDVRDDPVRDRFLLSKGHGPIAYYAVLAAKGFIPLDWLASGRTTRRSGATRTGHWCPGWRSGPGRWGTGCRSRSVRRWGYGRRG